MQWELKILATKVGQTGTQGRHNKKRNSQAVDRLSTEYGELNSSIKILVARRVQLDGD